MEKNIYSIIQDWHELFKNGTINEHEFNLKKNELLNFEKIKNEAGEKAKDIEKIEYEKSKKFFNRAYIFTAVIFALIFSFIIYNNVKDNNEGNIEQASFENEPNENDNKLGNYIVNADSLNLVHFYDEPEISTAKKSYFSTNDTVYVAQIENNFGYVSFINSSGQRSSGWLPLIKMNYCQECEN
jgi:quinol-cytochrome oxidoreductase complex cytochrome b subunit